MTLAYAGCRLSETLALTADRVDLAASVLVCENLKKRLAGTRRICRRGGWLEPRRFTHVPLWREPP
jgi:hypothetical protein